MTRPTGHLSSLLLALLFVMPAIMLRAADGSSDYATPEFKQRIERAYLADRLTDVRDAFIDIVEKNPSLTNKTTAYLALVELYRNERHHVDLAALPELRKLIEAHRSELSRDLQYAFDRSQIQLLQTEGKYGEAADAATAMRIAWEKSQLKTLTIHGDEIRLLCLAGRLDQAKRLVADTWLNAPNDFNHNAAVRSELASYLNDQNQTGQAYELLYQLLGSFRQELAAQPYLVQNLAEYAANSFSVGASQDQIQQRLEIIDLGLEVANSHGSEPVRAGLYFSMGKIAHVLRDADRAIKYYRQAILAAGTGEFDRNIVKWSDKNIKRLEDRDFSDLTGKDVPRPASDPWIAKKSDPPATIPVPPPPPSAPVTPVIETPPLSQTASPMPASPTAAPPAPTDDNSRWRLLAIACGLLLVLSAILWISRRFR